MLNEITLDTSQGKKNVKKVGPGLWGYIYKSEKEPFCYRLIPIEDVHAIITREKIKKLADSPRYRGIAPVRDVFQTEISGKTYLTVQYEVFAPSYWSDIIEKAESKTNLLYFIEILKILPFWWSQLGLGIIPLPSEIVFSDSTPFLLQIPLHESPDIDNLLDEPERIEYIAPEYFRLMKGKQSVEGRNLDIYALGVAIHKGLHIGTKKSWNIEDVRLMANGSYTGSKLLRKKLPLWCEKTVQILSVYNYINQIMARDLTHRSYYEPDRLSVILSDHLKYFESENVIDSLRKEGKHEMAYDLIKDILLDKKSYNILLIASDLASENKFVFEAVEYLEEAIKLFPNMPDKKAYTKQLELLTRQTPEFIVESVINKKNWLFEKTESMIERNYSMLSVEDQEDFVEDVARFMILQKKYEQVALLLYDHLYNEDKEFAWWKFDRTITYAHSLAGQGRTDESRELIASIRNSLDKVEMEHRISPDKIKKHRNHLSNVEDFIKNFKS